MDTKDAKLRYAAKKAFEDIRAGVKLGDDLIAELHMTPAMDYLRDEMTPEDLPRLIELAETGTEAISKLAVGILKDRKNFPEADRQKIRDLFMRLWGSRPEPPDIRINLMWRLLDYDDLSLEWHKNIYEFIKSSQSHWKDFLKTQLGYMGEGRSDKGKGDPKKVLPNLEKRLKDKRIPHSKHWAYFCSAMASDDIFGRLRLFDKYWPETNKFAKRIITKHGQGVYNFTEEIVTYLKKRCYRQLVRKPPQEELWSRHDTLLWRLLYKIYHPGTREPRCCSPQDEGYRDQLQEINEEILGHSRAERQFKGIIKNFFEALKTGEQPPFNELAEESLQEWKWHADFARKLAGQKTENRRRLSLVAFADAWAVRFACLCRLTLTDPLKQNHWFRGTFIDPSLASLPLPCRSISTESLVKRLPEAMAKDSVGVTPGKCKESAETLITELCESLRIIQWEVMPRDRFEETINGQILQLPGVFPHLRKIGLLSTKEHECLATELWNQEIRDFLQLATQKAYINIGNGFIDEKIDKIVIKQRVNNIYELVEKKFFGRDTIPDENEEFLQKKKDILFSLYQVFVRSVVEELNQFKDQNDRYSRDDLLIIEDGELTFFCLLRRLRHAMSMYSPLNVIPWLTGDTKTFCEINEDEQIFTLWRDSDAGNFMIRLGLFCPVAPDKWVVTSRFRSFANWFRKWHTMCLELQPKNIEDIEDFVKKHLPIKRVENHDKVFLLKLFSLLRSKRFLKGINKALATPEPVDTEKILKMIFGEFKGVSLLDELVYQELTCIFKLSIHKDSSYIEWAFSAKYEDKIYKGDLVDDAVLFRASRTCYLPIEDLVRSCQPCPMSLLIIPYDFRFPTHDEWPPFERAGFNKKQAIPTAIAFATISGPLCQVEEHGADYTCQPTNNCRRTNNLSPEWRHMYWSAFQSIAAAIATRSYEGMAASLSSYYTFRTERGRQGHEFKRILHCVDPYAHKDLIKFVQRYLYTIVLDEETILPRHFRDRNKKPINEFINNAMDFAGQVSYLRIAGGDNPEIVDENKIIKGGLEEIRPLLFSKNLERTEVKASERDTSENTRMIFFAMTVSLLHNILKWMVGKHPIIVRALPGHSQKLEFINVLNGSKDSAILNEEKRKKILLNKMHFHKPIRLLEDKKKMKMGGTEPSLEGYVALFSQGVKKGKVEMFPDENEHVFVTRVPVPDGLLLGFPKE